MTAPFLHITLNPPAREFATLERYHSDPAFRAQIEADRATGQAEISRTISGNLERFWARQRVRREVNEALEIITMETLS